MVIMEELFKNPIVYYSVAFVVYFFITTLINKYVNKENFDFGKSLIGALIGLLIFASYVTIFSN